MSKLAVIETAREKGLLCCTWSPGDGVTRYRFFRASDVPGSQSYFGPANGIYTALGRKDALAFIDGYAAAPQAVPHG